jgi:Peptidase M50B-like
MDAMAVIINRILDPQPAPSVATSIVTAAIALSMVGYRPAWQVTRHLATMVHEAAHGLAAAVSGRRLVGIRLHSNSSGVAVSSGPPSGPGMVLTAFAGYPGPALLGLACAGVLATGRSVAVLALLTVGLVLLLAQVRNFFGVLLVLSTGAAIAVVVWRFGDQLSVIVAHLLTWFLLFAAPRMVMELFNVRRHGQAPGSDADQLGRLTRLPGGIWVMIFFIVTVGALALGVLLLVP